MCMENMYGLFVQTSLTKCSCLAWSNLCAEGLCISALATLVAGLLTRFRLKLAGETLGPLCISVASTWRTGYIVSGSVVVHWRRKERRVSVDPVSKKLRSSSLTLREVVVGDKLPSLFSDVIQVDRL